jgi:predicted glycosyltransferase
MRVWIDLANSPHALLFAPISRRLQGDGHEVLVSVRDNAQTVELAREHWDDAVVIGGRSQPGRLAKGRAMLGRVRELTEWARRTAPDVALSHNSYAQLLAARRLRIPAVTAMDYEHQPVNHLAFRLADQILLPAALRGSGVERQGATARKARFYDGLKEEIYLGDFEPDPSVVAELGIDRAAVEVLVVARTPPSGALYHRTDNPLFGQILARIGERADARCVVLCRQPEQRRELAAMDLPNLVVPERAVDARSLLHAADLVVGAGGTMTREAALLEVPTVSVFAGRPAAVDGWLERRELLRRLRAVGDLPPLQPRPREPKQPADLRLRETALIDEFIAATTGERAAAVTPAHA